MQKQGNERSERDERDREDERDRGTGPAVFDRALLRRRRERAAPGLAAVDFLIREVGRAWRNVWPTSGGGSRWRSSSAAIPGSWRRRSAPARRSSA